MRISRAELSKYMIDNNIMLADVINVVIVSNSIRGKERVIFEQRVMEYIKTWQDTPEYIELPKQKVKS